MNLGSKLMSGSFEDLLVTAATWLLLAALGWLLLLVLAVVVEALSDGRWQPARWTLAPLSWRRALLALVVSLLATCGLSPAHADAPAAPSATTALEGLRLPSRPAGSLEPAAPIHVVRPGDSLWAIAQDLLPHASAAEVARLIARLHEQNRAVIGADPDVLVPGQRLVLPGLSTTPPDLRGSR